MKNRPGLQFLITLSLLVMLCAPLLIKPASAEPIDAWWDDDWPYRVPVNISTSGIVAANLNFTQLFNLIGLEGALLDLRSVRVVPYHNGHPGTPIPYTETYSKLFFDADTLNLESNLSIPYWVPEEDTTLSINRSRFTQGTGALQAHLQISITSGPKTGFSYYVNQPAPEDWSDYEILQYDIWPEVNASAIDQTPDLLYFELGGLGNCFIREVSGPALVMNAWNNANVSLKPYGTCAAPNLSRLDFLRFFVKVNRDWEQHGYFDPGDQLKLWMDNFRLVNQDGEGHLRWQADEGTDRYYIYFDTLTHAGHPPPELAVLPEPTLTVPHGLPQVGGYFHQVSGAASGTLSIWNAPPAEKILKTHQAPIDVKPLLIHAARGEFEPIQLVVRSPTTQHLPVSVSPLVHSSGSSTINPGQIRLFRVDYIKITKISDYYGRITSWPDPLYPITLGQKVTFPAGENQPLWIRVEVPPGVQAGLYSGDITIGKATLPINLMVWDFTLPQMPLIDSQFGFDWDAVLEAYRGTINGTPQACYSQLKEAIHETFTAYRLSPTLPGERYDPPEEVLLYSLTAYEITKAQTQQSQHGQIAWWEFTPIDHPPVPHPGVIDRPGMDARILPWMAWLDRIDGFYQHQTADWDGAPWETPFSNGFYNGHDYWFYPPKDNTIGFDPCLPESNRLVPSIRLELLREGLEDFAYLQLLNQGKPIINHPNEGDHLAMRFIASRTAYSRIPTAFDPIRAEIAATLEARQTRHYLPLFLR